MNKIIVRGKMSASNVYYVKIQVKRDTLLFHQWTVKCSTWSIETIICLPNYIPFETKLLIKFMLDWHLIRYNYL